MDVSLIPLSITLRKESLFEEGSIKENPEVPVYRETHPFAPLPKDVAQYEQVQNLCVGVIEIVVEGFIGLRRDKPEIFCSTEEKGGIPVDSRISVQRTAAKLIGDLEAKKNPKTPKINQFHQRKIEWVQEARKKLLEFFGKEVMFDTHTTEADIGRWAQESIKALFRVEVDPKDFHSIGKSINGYFGSLTYDQERHERFYKYCRAGFEVVEIPKVGDTVWYSGGTAFLQGVVTEKGIQTGVKGKKRVHSLFDVGSEYGREAIFLRRL
ncbi:MAG: hypothetical protein KDK64_08195 [Chlamydiia bacterium]|nr:hypothetical protein [Chlamydiia bacterium]